VLLDRPRRREAARGRWNSPLSPAIHRSGAGNQSPRLERTTMQFTTANIAIAQLGGEGLEESAAQR
jgi:hypothetical protein